MTDITTELLNLEELCRATQLSSEVVIEIVELGIIEPFGKAPRSWQFNAHMVAITRRALRLHHDFETDWPGIALALSLIDELEELRNRNKALEQRLNRFLTVPDSDQV